MMAAGTPVILSDIPENSDLPMAACLRVRPGIAEATELFEQMALAASFPRIVREIGEQARRHIRAHHSRESAAARIWDILCGVNRS
jgi:glycosyltransferase involved in cell wall biosynthesis